MKINKYLSNAREGLNSYAGKIPYAGKILTKEINFQKSLVSLLAPAVIWMSGCATPPTNFDKTMYFDIKTDPSDAELYFSKRKQGGGLTSLEKKRIMRISEEEIHMKKP